MKTAFSQRGTLRVFVYGSLLSGLGNHYHLRGAKFIGPARTRPGYALYSCGPYPAMVRVPGFPGRVLGEVYEVSPEQLAALDRLEGIPHHYQRVRLRLEGENTSRASCYVQPAERWGGRPREGFIPGGDWKAFHLARPGFARVASDECADECDDF